MKILGLKPDMGDLLKILAEIQYQWSSIGMALNIPEQGLQYQPSPNIVKLQTILQTWFDGNGKYSPVTWGQLIDAIEGPIIGNQRVADSIREYLAEDNTYKKYVERLQK